MFFINGGSLTINAGTYTAGSAERLETPWLGEYLGMAVTHGVAVRYKSGTYTQNGGTLVGYGAKAELGEAYASTKKMKSFRRNSVIELEGFAEHAININGGRIIAMAGANAFNLDRGYPNVGVNESEYWRWEYFTVRACDVYLETYDRIIAYRDGIRGNATYLYNTISKGIVGLNAHLPENTEAYIGADNVTNDKSTQYYSSSYMSFKPKSEIGNVILYGDDGTSLMWDKLVNQKYRVSLSDKYFPELTENDIVRDDSSLITFSLIDLEGKEYFKTTATRESLSANNVIDLYKLLPEDTKDELKTGETYYLTTELKDYRSTGKNDYIITSKNISDPGTPVMIVEPQPIKEAECTVTVPIPSEHPDFYAKIPDNVNYRTQVSWYTGDGTDTHISAANLFSIDSNYYTIVKFYAVYGYQFSDSPVIKINGKTAEIVDRGEEDGLPFVACKLKFSTMRDAIWSAGCKVTAPKAGGHPVLKASSEDETEYTVESVQVFEKDPPYKVLNESSVYEGSKSYIMRIRLKAAEGMRFTNETTFTVNNIVVPVSSNGNDLAVVDKEFKTGKLRLDTAEVTTEKSILTEGDKAFTPTFDSLEPSDYEVTFRNWLDYTAVETDGKIRYLSENDPFETGKTYNMNVTLKPVSDKYDIDIQTKLTINGVEAKFSSYSSEKQEYCYAIPMVCKHIISSAYCTVTEPTAGGSPVFTADSSDPTMYNVNYVDYSYVSNGTESHLGTGSVFEEGRQYRVYVEFEPTDGYMFADDAEFFINGVLANKYYSKRFRIFYVGEHEHKLTHWNRNEPTCTKEGSIEYWSCSLCHRNFADEACTKEITGSVKLPKVPHTPGTPVKEHETWFTYDSVIYCTVCGEELSREWVATSGPGHEHTPGEAHKENEVAATCTKEGGYDMICRCTECDDIISISHTTTDKLPHTPGEVKKENDTGDTWDDVTYCTVCNTELSRLHQTKDHQHTPGAPVKENEDENGYDEVIYCTDCHEELKREHIDKSGSVLLGMLGNMVKDSSITSADALAILRGSVGLYTIEENMKAIADIDGDDTITSADALAVLRYSVGLKDKNSKINTPVYIS